jgi:hypothetical protein
MPISGFQFAILSSALFRLCNVPAVPRYLSVTICLHIHLTQQRDGQCADEASRPAFCQQSSPESRVCADYLCGDRFQDLQVLLAKQPDNAPRVFSVQPLRSYRSVCAIASLIEA